MTRRAKGSFQRLIGADVIETLGENLGITGNDAVDKLAHAVTDDEGKNAEFLDQVADRMALGVSSVCSVLDPALIVLGGEVGYAGGEALADRVTAALPRIAPMEPKVVVGTADTEPVLRGAVKVALDTVRDELSQ